MMAQPFPAGMAQGHPAMAHAHPMAGMQHPGGHMGGPPNPAMMQGMHPGVSGPQVTQGPMVTGMPQGAGTPAPGGPMHNGSMAMAHLGPQQPMFQQQNPQMNFGQMPMNPQQQAMVRQQMMQRLQAQQQHQQQQGMPMGMPGGGPAAFTPAQMAQMKMNMPMQQQLQMQAASQHVQNFQQQQQHQQRMMAAHAQQQAVIAAQNQRAAAQQMQLSRSQEQPTSQPPQPHPTPAPQAPPQPQTQPTPQPQPQAAPPKPQAQPPPATSQPQPQPPPPVKQNEPEEEPQVKQQDPGNAMIMQDIPKEEFHGQSVLQLILYQDSLANPERPHDLEYWEEVVKKYFSPLGSLRQQLFHNRSASDKSFQLQFPSLARFFHAHFVSGIKQILLQSYDHNQLRLPNGGTHITSSNATLTYVFNNDIRVTTSGSLRVNFDDMNRIDLLNISTASWQEYIPRSALTQPVSPDQKQSPKMNKNAKRAQQQGKNTAGSGIPNIPSSGVCEYGVPQHIIQFLEIAEIMTAMGPLMEYFHSHPGIGPRESLMRITQESLMRNMQQAQGNPMALNNARLQNQMPRMPNGQPYPVNMQPVMGIPNQFASPAMAHLGLPQAQGSPHIGGPVHTPSPAQNPAVGGVAMMHQMSAQGSNLSGSQGPSTNTSPNVSNKRRRASAIKLEDENQPQDGNNANRVKPSPRIGGKRQKGTS